MRYATSVLVAILAAGCLSPGALDQPSETGGTDTACSSEYRWLGPQGFTDRFPMNASAWSWGAQLAGASADGTPPPLRVPLVTRVSPGYVGFNVTLAVRADQDTTSVDAQAGLQTTGILMEPPGLVVPMAASLTAQDYYTAHVHVPDARNITAPLDDAVEFSTRYLVAPPNTLRLISEPGTPDPRRVPSLEFRYCP